MATNNALNNSSSPFTVSSGNLVVTTGNMSTSAGSISSATTLTGGTGITATTGNIVATTGNISTTAGSITSATTLTATSGAITATAGDLVLTAGNANIGNITAGTTSPIVQFKKSRAGSTITTGDVLATIKLSGHDGTQYTDGARITSTSSGTIANTRVAGDLKFYTHSDSAAADPTLRMTIAPTGAVTIASPDSGVGLTVSGGGLTVTSGNIAASSGTVSASTTVTAGTNLISTAGLLELPTTSSTAGQITINSVPFLHSYGATTNTFVGSNSGNFTLNPTFATHNTAVGNNTLNAITGTAANEGSRSVAIGDTTLQSMTTGYRNTACGYSSMISLTTGRLNSVLGTAIFQNLISGEYNIGIGGISTGLNYTGSESSNILIGQVSGTTGESNVLYIGAATGTNAGELNKAIICGISGKTSTSGAAVYVNASNVLGTSTSTAASKQDIADIGEDSSVIYNLRPRSFKYIDDATDAKGDKPKQFGMVAEEVAPVFPEMVLYDNEGQPWNLAYHFLPPMLVNEVQKLNTRLKAAEATIVALDARLKALETGGVV